MLRDIINRWYNFINRRTYVAGEFVAAFVVLPLLALFGIPKLAILMVGLVYCAIVYPSLPVPVKKPDLTLMLKRFLFLMSMAFLLLLVIDYHMIAIVIRENFTDFLWTIPLYPLLSVIPQEFVYRRFFFKRYSPYLPQRLLFFFNVVIFSYAHIGCGNIYAVALTTIAGGVFAETYLRTKNFWLVCLEHAIYGLVIFGMGWGYHFM